MSGIMKRAIKKAEGFDPTILMLNEGNLKPEIKEINDYQIIFHRGSHVYYFSWAYNIHRLIFATDFISKLVGERLVCDYCGEEKSIVIESVCCGFFTEFIKVSDYHLRKMSTLRDVDKIIKYIQEEILKGYIGGEG